MKPLFLIVISLAWLTVILKDARGCSCYEYDVPVCATYWRSDAVFAGQLLDITPVEKKSDNQLPTVMLHFVVEQPFRGVAGDRVDVETLHGTSCDMEFHKGGRYLIYASREQGNGNLFAGPCTRTMNLKDAVEDLNYLRSVTQQKESILGRLLRNRDEPLPEVKVTVQVDDKTLETKTDQKGNFSLLLPGPGKYKVRTYIPFAADVLANRQDEAGKLDASDALTTFEYEVQIAKNQCHYRQVDVYKIDLHATAEVSGSVLTGSGRPVSLGYVYLVNSSDPDDSIYNKLQDDGSFKFEGVAVGEYYLIINPLNEAPGEDDGPYPRTYYPNAAEPSAATKIVVTEGAKLENLTLRVGQSWRRRVVTGKVVWEDGRIAPNASISLYDGDRYIRRIKLDEKGRFNFTVYGDFKYAILADAFGENRGESERISLTEKSTGLKLVLKTR